MKDIYDIFDEFQEQSANGAKNEFCMALKEYIHKKYKGKDERADRALFIDACADYILDLEMYQNPDFNPQSDENLKRIKNTASKNVSNWLNQSKSIKRETIIDIAFILADIEEMNGEDIANDLLKNMHFPKLHSSSEIEIVYIYALRNGLKYTDCLKLYKSYLARNGVASSEYKEKQIDKTSTVFHNELINIINQDELFSFLDSQRHHFGVASRKMNSLVLKLFYRMLSYKIIIESDESNNTTVTTVIKKAIEEEKHNTNSIESSLVEDCLKLAVHEPFVLYLSNKKTAYSLYNIILKAGGSVEIFDSKYQSLMDLKLDFFLFYASNDSLVAFKERFVKETMGQDQTPEENHGLDRLAYDEYIKNYDDYIDDSILKARDTNKPLYHKYIMDRKNNHPVFYPIKGHPSPKDPLRDAEDGCLFSTVFDNFIEVLKNKKSLSREGLLLWLLFYYRIDGFKEDYLNIADINDLISDRYSILNENNYFDNFIITVLSIESEHGKIFYKRDGHKEEINKDDLNAENIHKLRHSIIRLFKDNFDPYFAAEYFTEKLDNSTTSTIFSSTQKRLGIK